MIVQIPTLPSGLLTLKEVTDIKERLEFEANRSQYPEYADALRLIQDLEDDLRGTIMLVAQADTGKHLRTDGRFALVVDDAKQVTKRRGFFKYWDKDDV